MMALASSRRFERAFHIARTVSAQAAAAEAAAPAATTVRDALNQAAATFRMRNAFRDPSGDLRWNHHDYHSHINAFANMLVDMRFKPGDRLAVCHRNSADYIIAQLGAAKAGVTIVNLNPASTSEEFQSVLAAEKCRGVMFDTAKDQTTLASVRGAFPEMEAAVLGNPLVSKKHPYTQWLIQTAFNKVPGTHRLRDVLVYNPIPNPLPKIPVSASTEAQVTYSDGKKVSSHTQGDILKAATSYIAAMNLHEEDTVALAIPNSTGRGYAASVACAVAGAQAVVLPDTVSGALQAMSVECNAGMTSASGLVGLTNADEFSKFKYNIKKVLVVDATKNDAAAGSLKSKLRCETAAAIQA